jgi:hypothetical protein
MLGDKNLAEKVTVRVRREPERATEVRHRDSIDQYCSKTGHLMLF